MNVPANSRPLSAPPPGSPRGAERTGARGPWLALLLLLLAPPCPAAAAGQQVHGENSVFAGHGVAVAWAVLKGATEAETQVLIRIVPAGGGYAYVSLEGIDPFTQKRQEILAGQPLGRQADVRSPRATFADFPRREIHLYTLEGWRAGQPTLTVYFLGLPDTAPEFTSEAALLAYLGDALAKAMGAR
ncbi:MAG TPA: hypothetical protein VLT62_31995 [Candidatus Methylomirabilis sp.]|nr:hypothetical protein [Candidatus Methylomirabilis sp.]